MSPLYRAIVFCAAASIPLSTSALEPEQLFEKISPSAWGVTQLDVDQRPSGWGSAVVIGPGRLITNCHVLKGAKSLLVTKMNISYGASLEFADPERDLCQIKVMNFYAPAVEMGDASKLRVGQKVYAIGNPQGLELTLSEGLISSLRSIEENDLPLVQTTAAMSPGSSGGGLYDRDGKLIGITTFGAVNGQNLNFAHPVNWISEIEARHKALIAKAEEKTTVGTQSNTVPGYKGPHRIGDQWVYALTDRYTKVKRTVRYSVDEIDVPTEKVSFNQGGKVEDMDGNVVSVTASIGGEFDMSMPPQGWVRLPLETQSSWNASYQKSNRRGSAIYQFDLKARVIAEETVVVPAGTFKTTRIDWNGYAVQDRESGVYEAKVWYSKELNRIVKFSAQYAGTNVGPMSTRSDEVLELASHPGSKNR